MRTSGETALKSRTQTIRHFLALTVMAGAAILLQACNGRVDPPYIAPTSNNPAPGVTLQAIQITPATSLISIGEKRQMIATGVYSDGSISNLTSEVTWTASSAPSTTNFVSINPSGMATGRAIGATNISAALGGVLGVIQLTVETNGFTSSTIAILSVPYKSTIVDAAYLPQQTMIEGAYAVQEVNLDADQFSNVLPVPLALLASVPMPAGFVPNATAASQSGFLVAVISYGSPDVQIIDASNLSADLLNNTVINTFKAPVTQTVKINGISCMVCSAVVNPVTNQLLLGTAQGYYSMDMVVSSPTFGAFTPLFPQTAAAPAQNFSLNPIATDPYILAPDPATAEIQILNLKTNLVTVVNSGLTAPDAVALDLLTGYAAIVDANSNSQALLTLTNPQSPLFSPVSGMGVCGSPGPQDLDMVALGVSQNIIASNTVHTLFTSQTSGNCAGFEVWPSPVDSGQSQGQLQESQVAYGYGPMPNTPDGNVFLNGSDPNAITTFNSVVDKKNYGLLVDGNPKVNQQWIAKINFSNVFANNFSITNSFLPSGYAIPAASLCATLAVCNPVPVIFLPTPSTSVTVSVTNINFGSLSVGTSSPPIPVTLSNIGAVQISPVISLQGANTGDFSLATNCSNFLEAQSNCSISVTFTPTASGARSAVLNIAYGGANPETVQLSGTGQ